MTIKILLDVESKPREGAPIELFYKRGAFLREIGNLSAERRQELAETAADAVREAILWAGAFAQRKRLDQAIEVTE